ncbi:MAG: aspartate--tRNA ligase [Myxococcales bacterium]|nr:aspartate--tRNA ligase [Myxococcales bacterium]
MTLLSEGRTHDCGELREADVGSEVRLFGWVQKRRDHGGAVFIDLRDRYGLTQVVFRPDAEAASHEAAGELRSEFCIGVRGRVDSRGDKKNPKLPTGEIEVTASELTIFSRSETPPFLIEDDIDTREALRLSHRTLDLRRAPLQRALRQRADVLRAVRSVLDERRYLEIETPFLVRNTPGGARNFLVPSRLERGSVYALAESPQIYKQLLMCAGFDRYYQIVRCFRDEDFRGDRQPEFTQIDIEQSFATEEQIYELIERLMSRVFAQVLEVPLTTPFPRLTYEDALARFGTDKPDLRYELPLCDVTETVRGCGFRVFAGAVERGGKVKALRLPGAAPSLSRKDLDGLPALVKEVGAKGVAYARIQAEGAWQAPFAKTLDDEVKARVNTETGAEEGDVLLFLADGALVVNNALSLLRQHMADRFGLIDSERWAPVWITDFPLLERTEAGQGSEWTACHHPFTAPHPDDVELLDDPTRYGDVRARAYDFVLNGVEAAGGSIRIHQPDVQQRVFRALGIDEEQARAKFGFLLDAFRYGPPPHGGVAIGVDRLVMLIAGAQSLRDVMAFPKSQKGHDLLSGAPSPADAAQLAELGVSITAPPPSGGDG